MDKAALYLRLSKEDVDKLNKGDDSESIVNQRLLLTDYALEKGMQVVDVYADDDYSGLYDDRPEFDRLIRDGKLGKFNVVIAKSQSRFTRNMEHMEKYLHHDFPLMGIRFIGVVDGVDTQEKGNKKARQIYGLTNEWYCEDLSENIRSVFKQKMKDGQFIGSFAPYGYVKDPSDRHKLIIDEEAAGVVRQIFAWCLEGYGTISICHMLEERGIPAPSVYKKQAGMTYNKRKNSIFSETYALWSSTTVNRILHNQLYIGDLEQGKTRKLSYKDKKMIVVPKEEWITVKGSHEPIVAPDIFYRVQRLKEERRRIPGDRTDNPLGGKIRCAACGSVMIRSGKTRKKDDWYLRCRLANKSRNRECTSHLIRASAVEQAVLDSIQSLVVPVLDGDTKLLKELSGVLFELETDTGKRELLKKEIAVLQKKMAGFDKAMPVLYVDRAEGVISKEEFLQIKGRMEKERDETAVLLAVKQEEVQRLQKKKDGPSLEKLIKKYCNYTRLTDEMAADFIDYIEVTEKDACKKQEIRIHWNL